MDAPDPTILLPARVETSAGGVVVRKIQGRLHALVIRDPYGKWGLPKGHVEGDETLDQTALREIREETGLEDVELGDELVTIDWTFRAHGRQIHKFTTFFLMYSERGDTNPARDEGITACEWVPLAAADQRISYDNAREVVRIAQGMLLRSKPATAGEQETP